MVSDMLQTNPANSDRLSPIYALAIISGMINMINIFQYLLSSLYIIAKVNIGILIKKIVGLLTTTRVPSS